MSNRGERKKERDEERERDNEKRKRKEKKKEMTRGAIEIWLMSLKLVTIWYLFPTRVLFQDQIKTDTFKKFLHY